MNYPFKNCSLKAPKLVLLCYGIAEKPTLGSFILMSAGAGPVEKTVKDAAELYENKPILLTSPHPSTGGRRDPPSCFQQRHGCRPADKHEHFTAVYDF